MTYTITVPVGTDRYSLVSDLQVMSGEIAAHLQAVDDKTVGAVRNGDSPTFATLSSVSAPSFPSVDITGTRPLSKVANDAVNGFGLKSQNLYLTTKDGTNWVSTGHIEVPDGGTGTEVVNRNGLDVEVNSLQAQLTAIDNRLAVVEAVYASEGYVDGKESTLSSRVSAAESNIASLTTSVNSKANYYQQANKVYNAQNAASATNAGYATSAGSATNATTAANATKFRSRGLAVGRSYYGSLGGGKTGEMTITHNLGYTPVVLANAYNDSGIMSIACSVGGINGSTAVIKFKNLNNTTSESFSINWMAI